MDYIIREVKLDEIEKALSFVLDVFLEFNAKHCSDLGVQTFKQSIVESTEFREKFIIKDQRMLGAFIDKQIIGVISISKRNHISLLFVDKNYHKQGIAKKLFDYVVCIAKDNNMYNITLNSSVYAYEFYKKIGFKGEYIEKNLNGIRYIPLEIDISK